MFISANADIIESVHIVNDSDQSLRADIGIPAHNRADILITKMNDIQDALYKAILNDSVVEIKKAVQAGADINKRKDNKPLLLWAILLNRYNAIAELIQLGVTFDDFCAQQIIKMQDIKFLLLLVKQGQLNFDVQKVTGVIRRSLICQKNYDVALELIKELVCHGYNVNELWNTAIILAFYRQLEGEEAIRFLITRGANPNYEAKNTSHYYTPLSLSAVDLPTKKIVQILIAAGADINQKIRPRGKVCSLLSSVIERCGSSKQRQEIIELLLEKGAIL